MLLNTKHFGEIELEEDKFLNFKEGLPGFPDSTTFILLHENDDNIFYWLQSIDDGNLAFALINMLKIMPDYNPMVSEGEVFSLGEDSLDNIVNYNIVVIPENIKDMTANLLAPVVINSKTKQGRQIISTNDYDIKFRIFDLL